MYHGARQVQRAFSPHTLSVPLSEALPFRYRDPSIIILVRYARNGPAGTGQMACDSDATRQEVIGEERTWAVTRADNLQIIEVDSFLNAGTT